MVNLANLRKAVAYGQTMLSDRSRLVDKIWWTMPELKHLKNKTFWVIYKQLRRPVLCEACGAKLASLAFKWASPTTALVLIKKKS